MHYSLKHSLAECLIETHQKYVVTCASGSRMLLGRAEFDI